MKFHFATCTTVQRYLHCGHCTHIFKNWPTFIAHINTKAYSDTFLWQNFYKWKNPFIIPEIDSVGAAMQQAGLQISTPQLIAKSTTDNQTANAAATASTASLLLPCASFQLYNLLYRSFFLSQSLHRHHLCLYP